ncbi:Snf7-domain-containing protein [Sphaerosporella brunnea]|uniref:Snf7-domain-containing protein n=1 Tax=Sphaerosporella brunnea TaxID=1250544 RepID=A0A5J5ECM4_9PEZI|nr:Snf7-domain-containing protein [Sphaerosporella brunnea]
MESIKAMFWKPDPAAQLRKCNQLIRKNTRELDRHVVNLRQLEAKTRSLILQSSKSRHNTPQQTRTLAVELVRIRRQSTRLTTSRAQLQSVMMQVNEAFSVRKIEGSIRASTSVMKDVNSLVRLPELTGTMRELSQELMKAGIIEEMMDDALPSGEEELDMDEDAEEEVDKVLSDILAGRMQKTGEVPSEVPAAVAEPESEPFADEVGLEDMRQRLAILKS